MRRKNFVDNGQEARILQKTMVAYRWERDARRVCTVELLVLLSWIMEDSNQRLFDLSHATQDPLTSDVLMLEREVAIEHSSGRISDSA